MNNFSKDMLLESQSGFMMPFEAEEGKEIPVTLGYGEQTHPFTGGTFHHSGMDFAVTNKPLYAVATGVISGVGNDAVHGDYVIMRYGQWEVKYGHVSNVLARYGMSIGAGQQVAVSGDFLHLGVKFEGREIDPGDFLSMIYGNIVQLTAMGMRTRPQVVNNGIDVHTDYDNDMDDVVGLMLRYLPDFIFDITKGSYAPSERMEQQLRTIFQQSASRNYFYEVMPYAGNPLGLSSRAAPLASKVQNLLISEFLGYLAVRKNAYLPSWGDEQKKNFQGRFLATGY